jgi:hypothetical protein
VYAIVIDRIKGDPGEVARTLAEALGRSAYELRASAQAPGGGPAVVGVHAERAPADLAASRLSERGIDAFVHPVRDPLPERMLVRSVELTDVALRLTTRQATTIVVDLGSIELFVRSMRQSESTRTETVRERKIALGKALLTGGLVTRSTEETTHTTTTTDAQEVVFVFAAGHPVALLGESEMIYPSLGGALQVSRPANIRHLLAELRRSAPQSLWDDRLLRRATQVQTLGPVLSPDEHLDFAAALRAASLLPRSPRTDGLARVPLFSG